MIGHLRKDGIVYVGCDPSLPPKVWSYLVTKKQWNNHVKQGGVEPVPDPSSTCWAMEDVVNAPGLLEAANKFLPIAEQYLGNPLMYSVNAFTTYPRQGATQGDIQEFHRDKDDIKFLVLFVYLTDVLLSCDGPHEYCEGTQDGGPQTVFPARQVFGPAGTMFLADTRALHRGIRPVSKPRTIAWVRWGVSDPPASYGWDKLAPVSLTGDRRFSQRELNTMRLVVRSY